MALSFDPDGTRIILIGTTVCSNDFEHLPPLPSVANNLERLKQLFQDEHIIGLPEKCIEVIKDPPSASKLLTRINAIAKQAKDTLLIYYAGHGMKSINAQGLFIATEETTQDSCHLDGADFNRIRQIIFDAPASKKILLFDCCYSGEVLTKEMGGSEQSIIADNVTVKGTYAITSGPRNSLSYAMPDEKYTAFTKELIGVVENGTNDNIEYLTLDKVFSELKRRILLNPKLPVPQRSVELDGDFVFAKNAIWFLDSEKRIQRIEKHYESLLAQARLDAGMQVDKLNAEFNRQRSEIENRHKDYIHKTEIREKELEQRAAEAEARLAQKSESKLTSTLRAWHIILLWAMLWFVSIFAISFTVSTGEAVYLKIPNPDDVWARSKIHSTALAIMAANTVVLFYFVRKFLRDYSVVSFYTSHIVLTPARKATLLILLALPYLIALLAFVFGADLA
jgi:Caspase domain